MENNLENRVSMFQKTQGYLELHVSTTSIIPIIAALKAELDTRINDILKLASTSDTDITGYTVQKQAARMILKGGIVKLSTAVVAFASLNDKFPLIEKCDESPAVMDRMRDNDFYTYSKLVLSEATVVIADLADFNVLPADLAAATVFANNFLAVIQTPRVQITDRSRVLLELNNSVTDTNSFLNDKLDKVMGVFQANEETFFFGYLSARSIDDTGSNTPADYEGVIPPNGITAVAKMTYLAGRSFDIKNTGNVEVIFALSTTDTTIEGNLVNIDANSAVTRKTTTLNLDMSAEHLVFQNSDANLASSYKIWVND